MLRSRSSSEGWPKKTLAASCNRPTRNGTRKAICLAASIVLLACSASAYSADANYTYDALGRLTKVAYTDGVKTTTVTYSYDAAGNRTSVVSTSPS